MRLVVKQYLEWEKLTGQKLDPHLYIDNHYFDNIPLPGFTLSENNRKNWGSKDETWLIVDPRGFFARISNDNLNDILHVTGITEGLIQEKCVWAREDSKSP